MFFSKIAYAGLALLSIATSSFASPVAAPEAETGVVVKRADDLLNQLQGFQNTVNPLIDSFSGSPADVDALATVFADITAKINVDVFVVADLDVVIDLVVDIVVKLLTKLSVFLFLDVNLSVKIDVFLSAFITALDNKHHGCGSAIGAKIPITLDLSVLVSLKLVLSATILGLVNVLAILGL
ncbi:hypothetical protein C8Q75DRAFT_489279 [Abortiporus biennis]|nr:hypothetical protein C8Q75DRAFT_489279 [Abortiporus biennis]